jgi:two-component system chemotaxis response regulator CheB
MRDPSDIPNPKSKIRVLLVDDSPLVLNFLQRLLSRSPEIQVVGTAANGKDGLHMVLTLNPDVVCTDLHMPVMNGLEFTRAVMSTCPCPILVVSVSVEPGSANIFQLLEAGAVDVFPKPRSIFDTDFDAVANGLASKIRILAGVRVFRRRNIAYVVAISKPAEVSTPQFQPKMLVIGGSTGGPQALREILPQLPATFRLPLVCIQHIGSNFLSEMVTWLAEVSMMPVRKAIHGEFPQPGVIYFAPENAHLEFDNGGHFALSLATPVDGHRPSITVTMRSAAHFFGTGAVGVLLSGMGRDGADGMASIAAAGGTTIVQDEASSVVYGMPKEAVALGAAKHILPLGEIAPAIVALANSQSIDVNNYISKRFIT